MTNMFNEVMDRGNRRRQCLSLRNRPEISSVVSDFGNSDKSSGNMTQSYNRSASLTKLEGSRDMISECV